MSVRTGKAVERFSVENYGAFYAGRYQEMRDTMLILARKRTDEPHMRESRIRNAIYAHRSMMRCLREAKRDRGIA